MTALLANWEKQYEPPRKFASPLVHNTDWKPLISRLSRMCPLVEEQTQRRVAQTLNLFPKDALIVPEWKSFNQIIEQCLRILKRLRQTMICFDFKWVKEMVAIDLSKTTIDVERATIIISWDPNFSKYFKFIWSWYDWDIHLPNGILRAKVETRWQWEFVFSFPHVPYWFHDTCDRAKRHSLRAEIKNITEARNFFKWLKSKNSWNIPYSISNSKWEIQWVLKDVSSNWIWIYIPNAIIAGYRKWWEPQNYNLSLPDSNMKVSLKIKSVVQVEWENFSLVWAEFVFSDKTRDRDTIDSLLFGLNGEISDEIRRLKEIVDFD